MSLVMRAFHCVECFHMTSWWPMILVFRNIDVHPTDVVVRNKPRKGFLLFQSICIDAGHVSENALYTLLNKANVQANIVITFIVTKPSDPNSSATF